MRSGFTLIEVLVTATIIGLLSTIGFVSYKSVSGQGRYDRAVNDMNNILTAAQLYYQANGNYPDDTWPGPVAELVPAFMQQWPNPPCTNMIYDWENWPAAGPPWSPGNTDGILRVSLRNNNPPTYTMKFYLCLSTKGSDCLGGWSGLDAKTLSPKSLDCN